LNSQPLILLIEADIESGNFDISLKKYKRKVETAGGFACSKLFGQWIDSKIGLSERTEEWHQTSINKLISICGDVDVKSIGFAEVKRFYLSLSNLSRTTQRRRIETLRACWDWGISENLVQSNPWTKLPKIQPEKPNPKPFTKEEINKILIVIKQKYPDLLPLIKFMLSTGCRIGEALGLKAGDISNDFKKVSIVRQLTRKEIKLPKNNKKREIYISESTANLLRELKTDKGFLFHNGDWSDENIANRWRKILKAAEVPYRSPYSCRHTFISHCLNMGMNPVKIAAITGHDVKTLLTHYAGLVDKPTVPELELFG
jgi:integrase